MYSTVHIRESREVEKQGNKTQQKVIKTKSKEVKEWQGSDL